VINNKKNLGINQTQPHRVRHVDSSSYRPQNDFCRSCRDEEEEETVALTSRGANKQVILLKEEQERESN